MNDHIHQQREHQEHVANHAYDAVQDLTRALNTGTVTAPAAYAVLGNQKLMLSHLEEVNTRLIHGLQASLTDPRITITDCDFMTGTERDPVAQITYATHQLQTACNAIRSAAQAVAKAQEALNGQGFTATARIEV